MQVACRYACVSLYLHFAVKIRHFDRLWLARELHIFSFQNTENDIASEPIYRAV